MIRRILVVIGLSAAVWAKGEVTNTPPAIVVTAARVETLLETVPDIIQVIPRSEIEMTLPSSTGKLFEYSSGAGTSTGTGSGFPKRTVVSLNGLPPKYTLVLVDGVPLLSEHIHTGQNLDLIPPSAIERIEILRGGASAQYGRDAMGGVINIITRKAEDQPTGSLGFSAGSHNTLQALASALLPLSKSVSLSSIVNWEKSDGQPLQQPTHRVGYTGYETLSFQNRLDMKVSDQTKLFATVNGSVNEMEWSGDWADSRLLSISGGLDQELAPGLDLFVRIAHSDWQADVSEERNRTTKPELFIRWAATASHTLTAGGDYQYNTFERTALDAPEQTSWGTFIQDEWRVTDTFSMMAALRYDYVHDVCGAVSPKISTLWTPTGQVSLRASAARGFHAPTLQELYEKGYGHGGSAYRFGNPDLDPEYSTTYTAGIELEPTDNLQFMLNGFYSGFKDMIVPVYQGPWDEDQSIDVWERMNIAEAVVYGLDAGARWRISQQFRVDGGGTWTDNRNQETGRKLPYNPGTSLYSKLTFADQFAGHNGSVFVGARAAFDRSAWSWKPATGTANDNADGLTTDLENYVAVDLGITLEITPSLTGFVKVENLTGEDIESLDDSYTVLDGEPFVRCGMTCTF